MSFGGRVNGLADGLDVDMRERKEPGRRRRFRLEQPSDPRYRFLRWETLGKKQIRDRIGFKSLIWPFKL